MFLASAVIVLAHFKMISLTETVAMLEYFSTRAVSGHACRTKLDQRNMDPIWIQGRALGWGSRGVPLILKTFQHMSVKGDGKFANLSVILGKERVKVKFDILVGCYSLFNIHSGCFSK